jgi:hypothetical protein
MRLNIAAALAAVVSTLASHSVRSPDAALTALDLL